MSIDRSAPGGCSRRSPTTEVDRSFLLQFQQDGIQRALIQREQVAADLLDAAGRCRNRAEVPSTSRVLSTMSASVPCRTSVFSLIGSIGFPTGSVPHFILESNRSVFGGYCPKFGSNSGLFSVCAALKGSATSDASAFALVRRTHSQHNRSVDGVDGVGKIWCCTSSRNRIPAALNHTVPEWVEGAPKAGD